MLNWVSKFMFTIKKSIINGHQIREICNKTLHKGKKLITLAKAYSDSNSVLKFSVVV